MSAVEVLHFTDPGCPWAYSASPAHARLRWRFGDQLSWRMVMIGLTERAGQYVERGYTPDGIALLLRGFRERFGMPFAVEPKARMGGTAPGCRAVVAAREQDPVLGEAAFRALQLMQFTSTGLLDEPADLRSALSEVEGLDGDVVVSRLDEPEVVEAYERDRALAREAAGTPTEAQDRSATTDGPVRYTAPSLVFTRARDGRSLEVGGFQPFEAYDVALANLDPDLERRPAAEDAREVLAEFPSGLTTAEVAAVLRPSDLTDADFATAEDELLELVASGEATREARGHDAVWRPAG